MSVELTIQNKDMVFSPIVQEGITWSTERKGSPGTLQFKVLKDEKLNITEGDMVRLRVDNVDVFQGYIFKKSRDKEHLIQITATTNCGI